MGLPNIDILFKQRAASAVKRSARGIACIVVKDDTSNTPNIAEYKLISDFDASKFTASNAAAIKRAFLGGASKIVVVRIGNAQTFNDAVKLLDTVKYNWVCVVDDAMQDDLVTYIKGKNAVSKNKKYKAIVHNPTASDDMHIVATVNEQVTPKNETAISMVQYLPRLCGLLAGFPFTGSVSAYELEDLASVSPIENPDSEIDKGKFVLINDDGNVLVGSGVNSLKTTDATHTEDMKKIAIVEAMDMILEDIAAEFKKSFVGKYKNNYDNQSLLISAINGYFKTLAVESVLDSSFDNSVAVDVESQRSAWLASGKAEAADWDENKVKNMSVGSKVFLLGNVKILDAIENLRFEINMA